MKANRVLERNVLGNHSTPQQRHDSLCCRQPRPDRHFPKENGIVHRSMSSIRSSTLDDVAVAEKQEFTWKGKDEFSDLGDRLNKEPLPLPHIKSPKRMVLVRHGQSTWNAEGRIQGSTDFAVLTQKGESQADTTRQMLENDRFDTLFHSPLKRASKTASIVWGSREGNVVVLPSTREIDLYSFQGLMKQEGKERYGSQFTMWQKQAAEFEIDDQAPVRQLWYRASLAWQDILGREDVFSGLLVAHNAVNQALVATAAGFPPTMFRRMLQSNGATTVLDFTPHRDGPPTVTINRLNQSPGPPFGSAGFMGKGAGRLLLLRGGATEGPEGRLLGRGNDRLSTLGHVQAQKAAELLMDLEVNHIITSPLDRAKETAKPIANLQSLAGYKTPDIEENELLVDRDWGTFQGRLAQEVRFEDRCKQAEPLSKFEDRTRQALTEICGRSQERGGGTIAVVAHSAVLSALICHCLGLPEVEESLSLFRTDAGSVTVIDLPDPTQPAHGVVRCVNYTAHLGRWAIPVTRDDLDSEKVCGIDGCF